MSIEVCMCCSGLKAQVWPQRAATGPANSEAVIAPLLNTQSTSNILSVAAK